MTLKNSVILTFVFLNSFSTAQFILNSKPIQNNYNDVLMSTIKYYSDSTDKYLHNVWHVNMFYVSVVDTNCFNMKINCDYSFYNPIPFFNATHWLRYKGKICLVRFQNNFPCSVLRKLEVHLIGVKEISELKSLNKKHRSKVSISGDSQVFAFEINCGRLSKKWYSSSVSVPRAERVDDVNWNGTMLEYQKYLNDYKNCPK